ncbi:hypothetical protein BpHYR1_007064 [Brachionus plicatilis]|uniref:Uncharacterized protein n=1 Tax=Brachionus plicatilis TaxID=10195 RepID=A0A3M7QLS5_BRAPC|nr:hypothetical protein BpHYR1_007064 [Brachionus plicatilis]
MILITLIISSKINRSPGFKILNTEEPDLANLKKNSRLRLFFGAFRQIWIERPSAIRRSTITKELAEMGKTWEEARVKAKDRFEENQKVDKEKIMKFILLNIKFSTLWCIFLFKKKGFKGRIFRISSQKIEIQIALKIEKGSSNVVSIRQKKFNCENIKLLISNQYKILFVIKNKKFALRQSKKIIVSQQGL